MRDRLEKFIAGLNINVYQLDNALEVQISRECLQNGEIHKVTSDHAFQNPEDAVEHVRGVVEVAMNQIPVSLSQHPEEVHNARQD